MGAAVQLVKWHPRKGRCPRCRRFRLLEGVIVESTGTCVRRGYRDKPKHASKHVRVCLGCAERHRMEDAPCR